MLLALGVKSAGHWQGAHMSPIDGNAPDVETPAMSDGRGNSMNRYDYHVRHHRQRARPALLSTKARPSTPTPMPRPAAPCCSSRAASPTRSTTRPASTCSVTAATIRRPWSKRRRSPSSRRRSASSRSRSCTRSNEFNAACRTDVPFMAGELDGKCTVGITPKKSNWAVPIDEGAVPRLSGDRRRHLHLRRRAGRHPGARDQHLLRADQWPLRVRRRDRAVLPQLSVLHRADPQRRVQLSRRPRTPPRCSARTERLTRWQRPRPRTDLARSSNSPNGCWRRAPRTSPTAAINQAKLLLLDAIGCGYAAFEEESHASGARDAQGHGRRAAMHRDRQRHQDQRAERGAGQWLADPHSRPQRLRQHQERPDRRPSQRQHSGRARRRRIRRRVRS